MNCEKKQFNISPKTPFNIIRSVTTWDSSLRKRIGQDITQNVRELAPDAQADLNVIISQFQKLTNSPTTREAQGAIDHAVAPTIGSIARDLGCDMHSPPIVYVCGSCFVSETKRQLTVINTRLRKIESGEIQFAIDENRLRELKKAEEGQSRTVNFRQRMIIGIQDYAKYALPQPDKYTEFLDKLFFKLTAKERFVIRERIFELVKNGQFEQAMLLLR